MRKQIHQRNKVVVIGTAGLLAGQILPVLQKRYELTLLDVRTTETHT